MYLGKDIPIGEYQKELKDARRSVTEQFLEYFVQDQALSLSEITLKIDDVCDKFRKWQEGGSEFERSKSSITRELALTSIPGILKIKPREFVFDLETNEDVEKQVPKYVFDLEKLRQRYKIGKPTPMHEERGEDEAVDCEADVASWEEECEKKASASAMAAHPPVRLTGEKRAREEDDDEEELDAAVEDEDDDEYESVVQVGEGDGEEEGEPAQRPLEQ